MTVKFSQFVAGALPQINDIVVGLRNYPANPINDKFNFSGVADTLGMPIVTYSAGSGPNVNYLDIQNAPTENAVILSTLGDDDVVNLTIIPKGNGIIDFDSNSAIAIPSGTTLEQPAGVAGGLRYNSTENYIEYWDLESNAWEPITAGSAPFDATYITQTDETAEIPESIPLSGLPTGLLASTTGTGNLQAVTLSSVASTRIVITNATGESGNPTFDLATTTVTPGSYVTANITVDAYGRVTAASDGTDIAIGVGLTVSQTAHGFSVGQAIYYDGSEYTLAIADSLIEAEVIGVVENVIDADNFTYISVGLLEGLSGLTPNVVGWLSDQTPGLITNTIPTTPGNVTKPIWIAISATQAMVYQERGKIIPNPAFTSFGWNLADSDTTIESANGYYNNGNGTITFTIPGSAEDGDYYQISGGTNTTPWVIQAPMGAVINVGASQTSAGGTVTANTQYDAVSILCVGSGVFNCYSVQGNLTTA